MLNFCLTVESLQDDLQYKPAEERRACLRTLYDTYLAASAPDRIELDPSVAQSVHAAVERAVQATGELQRVPEWACFREAYDYVYQLLNERYCPSFLHSTAYFEALLQNSQLTRPTPAPQPAASVAYATLTGVRGPQHPRLAATLSRSQIRRRVRESLQGPAARPADARGAGTAAGERARGGQLADTLRVGARRPGATGVGAYGVTATVSDDDAGTLTARPWATRNDTVDNESLELSDETRMASMAAVDSSSWVTSITGFDVVEDDGDRFANYTVEVRQGDASAGREEPLAWKAPDRSGTWSVQRRYTEFLNLYSILRRTMRRELAGVVMPSRHLFSRHDRAFFEARREELNRFLTELLGIPAVRTSHIMQTFLLPTRDFARACRAQTTSEFFARLLAVSEDAFSAPSMQEPMPIDPTRYRTLAAVLRRTRRWAMHNTTAAAASFAP